MKKIIVAMIFLPTIANAEIYDWAEVIYSEPNYRVVTKQHCDTQVQISQEPGYGGAVIGGIVGGLLGNQVGGGNGRTAATAVGAGVGAVTGYNMENRKQAPQQRICQNYQEQVIDGYNVTYRYRGMTDSIKTQNAPNNRIRVRISPMSN